MNSVRALAALVFSVLIACSSRSSSEESKQVLDTALVKENFA